MFSLISNVVLISSLFLLPLEKDKLSNYLYVMKEICHIFKDPIKKTLINITGNYTKYIIWIILTDCSTCNLQKINRLDILPLKVCISFEGYADCKAGIQ